MDVEAGVSKFVFSSEKDEESVSHVSGNVYVGDKLGDNRLNEDILDTKEQLDVVPKVKDVVKEEEDFIISDEGYSTQIKEEIEEATENMNPLL